MGKRELLLIIAFVAVGAIVYQVTAPPLQPGQQGVSLGGVLRNVRRDIAGRRVTSTVSTTHTEALDPSITEVRINVRAVDLRVVGEDRTDVSYEMQVESNGTDAEDAKKLAASTVLKVDHAGSGLVTTIEFPREGLQRATLTMKIPSRLALRVEAKTGRLEATQIASVDIKGNRGETRVTSIAGLAAVTHRGGALNIDGAGSLRVTVNGATGTIAHINGTASVEVAGSDLTLAGIVGPLDVTSRGTDVRLRTLDALKGPLRVDMQSGSLHVDGLAAEARIDGRNTDMNITMAKAVPLTIYNVGEDISVTPPAGGYTLDAIATDGRISIDDANVKPSGSETDQRAAGAVRGGGPALTLRATRGRIMIRAHESAASSGAKK